MGIYCNPKVQRISGTRGGKAKKMNILETFLILFESNADDVKKGADEAGRATDKLDDKIKDTQSTTDRLGKSFMGMAGQAAAAIGSIVSVGAIVASVFAAANYADYLDETSEALGVNVEQLDLWGRAAKMAGGSTEGLIGSVKSLSAGMAQMDVTGKSKLKPFFDDLGISMTDAAGKARDAFDIFPEIADAFEGMSKQEAIGFGRKLGLDDGTIMLLQKGRREIDALIKRQKELGTISAEDAKIAAEYKDSIDELSFAWRSFAGKIAGDVLPAFTWLIKKLTDIAAWMREHEGFIYGFLTSLTVLFTAIAIRAGIAALAVGALVSPFVIAAAAATAFGVAIGLLWDDFRKWTENPDLSYLDTMWKILTTPVISPAWNAFTNLLEDISDYIDESVQGIGRMLEAIGNIFSFGDRSYNKARLALSAAGGAPINSATSNSISNSAKSNNVSINEINIQTQATDAQGISAEIGRSMKGQIDQVNSNIDDGIRG